MSTNSTIGNLSVQITGDATQLIKAFNDAMDAVDKAAAKFDASTSKFGTTAESMALKVIAGARAFSEIHREIMHVIENIDKIPGMPPEVISTITQAKQEFSAFRNEIDVVLGKLIAFGVDVGHALGAGAAMLMGASDDDVSNGLAEHRGGRQMSDDEAQAKDLGYHDKVIEAEHKLAEAKAAVNLKDEDRAGKVEMLIAQAQRLQTYSQSNSINTLQSINAQIEAQHKLGEAAAARRTVENQITQEEVKYSALAQERSLAGVTQAEKLGVLKKEELEITKELLAFELPGGERTITQLENEKRLRADLNNVIQREIPLLRERQRVWDEMGEKISSTIQGMIVNGTGLRDNWHSILKDIEGDMVKTFLDGPLKSLFSNGLKSLFGGMSGGGGGLWGAIGSLFGAHAGGGNIDGPALVGENGPELFIPSGSGSILTSDSTKASMGGGKSGGTFYIDARGADNEGMKNLQAQIRALHGSIEYRAVAAVSDFQKRLAPA